MAAQELLQLLARVVLLHHGVTDVGAVEGADEVARVDQIQAFGDLALGRRIGGGGQRHARDMRPAFVQHRELAVFGAEIVAPLRDAMRLVDGKQRDAAAFQQGQEARVQ